MEEKVEPDYKHVYKRSMTVPDTDDIEMDKIYESNAGGNGMNASLVTSETSSKQTRQGRLFSLSVDETNLRSMRSTFDGTNEVDYILGPLHDTFDVFASHNMNFLGAANGSANNKNKSKSKNKKTKRDVNGTSGETLLLTEKEKEELTSVKEENKTIGECSNMETLFNTVNYSIGPALLTYPYSMVQGGYSISLIIVFVNFSSFFTAYLINSISSHYSHITQFDDLVELTLGTKSKPISAVLLTIELYLYVILYIVFAGELLYNSGYLELLNIDNYISSLTIAIVVMYIFIAPTLYLNNLKPLAKMSTISIISLLSAFVIVYIETGINYADGTSNTKDLKFFTNIIGFGYGIGACFGPYSIHPVIPNMRNSMKTPNSYLKIMVIVWTLILFCQLSIGLCGYFTYGNDSQTSITSNFSKYFAYIASVLLMIKSYSVPPLFLYPIVLIFLKWMQVRRFKKMNKNNEIEQSVKNNQDYKNVPKKYEMVFRTLFPLAALGLGLLLGDVSLVANMVGALCTSVLSVVLPAAMYIGFIKKQRAKGKAYAFNAIETLFCVMCVAVMSISFTLCVWNCICLVLYSI